MYKLILKVHISFQKKSKIMPLFTKKIQRRSICLHQNPRQKRTEKQILLDYFFTKRLIAWIWVVLVYGRKKSWSYFHAALSLCRFRYGLSYIHVYLHHLFNDHTIYHFLSTIIHKKQKVLASRWKLFILKNFRPQVWMLWLNFINIYKKSKRKMRYENSHYFIFWNFWASIFFMSESTFVVML